ncbi:MAG: hypothetical protein K2J49_09165, partial [Muribaculaceae bacterium]|nr:hypothetical protein [Muribaculaceae bacterium]
RNKPQGRPFSRDNRNDRGERKPFDRNGGREDYRRSDGRNDRGGFRNERDNRGGFRNDRDRDNRGGFRNDRDRDNRGGFRNERPTRESSYNPANSKGPRLPESSETVINTVHMRSRKGWKKQEGED